MPTLTLFQELVAERRARSPKKSLKRVPRQIYPISEEREYRRDLRRLSHALGVALETRVVPRFADIQRQANADRPEALRLDAWDDEVKRGISAIRIEFEREWSDEELARLARRRGEAISSTNRRAVKNQLRAVIGTDPFIAEPWLASQMSAFTSQNVNLIKSVPSRFFTEIESLAFSGFQQGKRWETIADELRERVKVSQSRMDLIARDQTSKLNGQLTMLRQTQIGIEGYTWSTSGDERVRDSHRAKDGKSFKWADPPADTGHPGEDINCRCVALPDLLSALPDADDE